MVATLAGTGYVDGEILHRPFWFSYREDRVYRVEADQTADIPVVDIIEIPLEQPFVSTPTMSRMDLFTVVTIPIVLAIGAAGWAVFDKLDGKIDAQRMEMKADVEGLSSKMDEQIRISGETNAEIGKLSGEIVKAKGEMIQEMSKLRINQAALENDRKPVSR